MIYKNYNLIYGNTYLCLFYSLINKYNVYYPYFINSSSNVN